MAVLERRRKVIELHPAQLQFRCSSALFRGFVGGRAAGKSYVGAYDAIRRGKRGRLYLVAAPTYEMLRDATLRSFLAMADELCVLNRADLYRQPPSVTLTTGAEFIFRSMDDPDRRRGPNISGAWLDEASQMPRPAFDTTIASLRQDGEQGWLSATFTPNGLSHWTYDVFGKATADTAIFHATTRDNPFNPAGFHETIAHQYSPVLAQQELEGLFCDVQGAEFPGEWFGEHLWVSDFPDSLSLRVIYLDPSLGKDASKGDYSAYVELGRDQQGVLYIAADMARRPTTQIVADGMRLAADFAPLDAFGVESNAFQQLLADDILRQSKEHGIALPIYHITNTVNKHDRIRRLTPYLSRGLVRFVERPGTRLLVQQLREFPMGDHDDGPDAMEGALRLAIELFNKRHARRAG